MSTLLVEQNKINYNLRKISSIQNYYIKICMKNNLELAMNKIINRSKGEIKEVSFNDDYDPNGYNNSCYNLLKLYIPNLKKYKLN